MLNVDCECCDEESLCARAMVKRGLKLGMEDCLHGFETSDYNVKECSASYKFCGAPSSHVPGTDCCSTLIFVLHH